MLKNDLLLKAARGEQTERIPIWLMRQAGRILPEYRAVRSSVHGFKELVKNPELICEVTLQPVDILGVDAAIIFSDILVIPEAMGLNYEMIESKGPFFPKTIQNAQDISVLTTDVVPNLQYVFESIRLTKAALNNRVPLIGFAGAPWTIFSYMIEGKGSKTFSEAKKMLYVNPVLSHQLLDKITSATIAYLKEQIRNGADIVQVFDSWAGVLSKAQYIEFALPYMQKITEAITEVPVILFAKDAHYIVKEFSQTNTSVIGLDWTIDPKQARMEAPNKTLQGNLDPCVLYADKETIKAETHKMLQAFGPQNYICNLGHGVYPDVDFEKAKYFIEVVQSYR
ncbi:MAG TPA: uroporphyrinogen decarboxylase [Chitinophagales bacterium]|nr:uroporphyrinogen decarboxylase [Chitinophagales bacterium]HMX60035.1 uroporphyrinogen decarboxylase [Chitinophagales bacterium]HMZ34244.1 uroporphyrinogen decarboxylase [Chitinophagales bacterium]HNA40370.1 uroporphyrinogen decarboxylase [Chitinophagales bacterium]HNB48659.1 uroporphyrinogen decarboxylase [Chitinophagales bacterium]